MSDTLRLHGAADLLAVIPHLLGYQPRGSLVVVGLESHAAGLKLGLIERLDLPPEGDAFNAAESLTGPMLRQEPAGVYLIGYEEVTGQSLVALEVLGDMLAGNGVKVVEAIMVCGDRFRSLHCDDPQCCPPQGAPVPTGEAAPAVEMITRGSSPAASREAVAARFAPAERSASVGQVCDVLAAHPEQLGAEDGLDAWAQVLTGDVVALSDSTLARAALSLHAGGTAQVRDALLVWMCPGSLPVDLKDPQTEALVASRVPLPWGGRDRPSHDDACAVLDRLIGLCAALPDQHAAPALTITGAFAWWIGDGTLASVSLARALRATPSYRLARLLSQMVGMALRLPTPARD